MAHSDHQTMRRVLRREIAGTIGLLTDEHDFRAMRRYRSFTFVDHEIYLEEVEALLRSRASQGSHTTIALFDPQQYAEFCRDTGLDPDAPSSRTRFTAELATTAPTIPYDGRPLSDVVPALVGEALRQATWEYASVLLARLGACATCGEDIGRAAFTRASGLLARILDTARRAADTSCAASPRLRKHSSPSCAPTRTTRARLTATRPKPWSSPRSWPSASPPGAPADS